MTSRTITSIIAFFLTFYLGTTAKEQCKKLLGNLAETQSLFLECMTNNGAPVTVCMNCTKHYNNMTISFKNLASNKNCSKEYFDNDRMNIVSTTQTILSGLWQRAFCESCSSNDTAKFQEKDDIFQNCLKNSSIENKDACVKCISPYLELNDYYKHMNEHNGEVCFDLQDKMNRSRSKWSKELKCCKREYDFFTFIATSTVVTSLPILFYIGLFMYTKRTERNHEMLISDPQTAEVVQEQPSTSQSGTGASSKLDLTDKRFNESERSTTQDNVSPLTSHVASVDSMQPLIYL